MKKKILILIAINLVLFAPVLAFAAGIVPCGGHNESPCNICYLFRGASNIVNFIVYDFAMPAAVAIIIYGGIMIVTAGASEANVKKGQTAIKRVIGGMIITLAAWIIVDTVLKILIVGSVSGVTDIGGWGPWTSIPGGC